MDYHLRQGRVDLEGVGHQCYVFVKTLEIFLLPVDQDSIQLIGVRNAIGQHT